jgi:hypothetical protein
LLLKLKVDFGVDKYKHLKIKLTQNQWTNVVFGKNSIEIDCIPHSKPYIPYSRNPTLFYLDEFYIDWLTGKIIVEKKALEYFDSCKLKTLLYLDADRIYCDNNGNNKRGIELIQEKRLNTKKWNKRIFEQ